MDISSFEGNEININRLKKKTEWCVKVPTFILKIENQNIINFQVWRSINAYKQRKHRILHKNPNFYSLNLQNQTPKAAYHERIPRHGGKKLIEQLCLPHLINKPNVTVAVGNGFVEVENNHNISHWYRNNTQKYKSLRDSDDEISSFWNHKSWIRFWRVPVL